MSSSINYLECKQCGGIAFNELNCNTLEEWQRCHRCGCGFDYEVKRNKKGKVIFNRKKRPKYRFRKRKGYGVVHFCFKKGNGVYYHLHKPLSRKNRKNFFLDIETNPEIDKEKSYLTVWNKKKKQIVSVYGIMPQSFQDMEKGYGNESETKEALL